MVVFQGSTQSNIQITKEVKTHNNIQKIIFKSILQKTSSIFCHIKILFRQQNKNCFKKIDRQLFNNQSVELSSSGESDNIIQEGEVIFKKNLTVDLPGVSKLKNTS